MHYMLFQINHPGTIHSQINTVTTLICEISHKNIFQSSQPAEIRQKYTYQDSSIRQCPFLLYVMKIPLSLIHLCDKYTIKLYFII